MEIRTFELGPFAVDTYLLWDAKTLEAAIVDPTMGSEAVLDEIKKLNLTLKYIINTHGHVDHVAGDAFFKRETEAPILIHEGDVPLLRASARQAISFGVRAEQAPEPDQLIADGDLIAVGGEQLAVLHTPGHSQGGVCIKGDNFVLVGDTLFFGSIGRTDFPGGSHEQLLDSVRNKLFVLPDDTKVYPGHGPATTVGWEKQYNPFFQDRPGSGLWLP